MPRLVIDSFTNPGEAFFPTTDGEMAQVRGTGIQGPFVFNAPDLSASSLDNRVSEALSGKR